MNLGTFLQTIITIVFIYLILALLASELQENIAGILKLRARRLKDSITHMFSGKTKDGTLTTKLYNHPSITVLYENTIEPSSIEPATFAIAVLSIVQEWDIVSLQELKKEQDPLVFLLTEKQDLLKQKQNLLTEQENTSPTSPSDVNQTKKDISDLEEEILVLNKKNSDLDLKFKNNINKEYEYRKKIYPYNLFNLSNLSNLSSTDWTEIQKNIERQFQEVQERSTGVYKRKAKGWSFIIGLVVAIIANADVFNIITNLSKTNQNYSDNLIEKIAAKSPELFPAEATGGQGLTKDQRDKLIKDQRNVISTIVDETGILPLGWDFDLEMEKQKRANDYTKNSKLIEFLNNNQSKIELLSKNEGECKDEKGKTKCFDDLSNQFDNFFQTDSNKELSSLFETDFITNFNNNNREKFSNQYINLLAKLKQDRRLKIFPKPPKPEEYSSSPKPKEDSSFLSFFNNLWLNVQRQGTWKPFVGWLISAIAISMGAPFWFDLLGNIMNVRNSGRDLKRKRN